MDEQTKNLNQAFLGAMDTYAPQTCFQVKRTGHYRYVSYREFQTLALRMTKFFTNQGITNGERVVIAATHSVEWMAAYIGCLLAGGVTVPVHLSLAPATLHFILQDSGARLAVLQDQEHLQKISAGLTADGDDHLPQLETILVISGDEDETLLGVTPMSAVLAEPLVTTEEEASIRSYAEAVAPEALATIRYVAGESGRSKGAVFDHAQCLAALRQIAGWFTFQDDELAFTIRPWSETPSLLVSHHYFLSGIANVLSENPETVPEDLRQTSPTVMLSVPYGSELFYKAYMSQLAEQSEAAQDVFRWALAKGKEYQAAGADASSELREEYARADMTFFSQIRGDLGGRMRRSYSTGAPLPPEIEEFFEVVGVSILNTYSLTEAGGFPAVSHADDRRPGSCGRVAPGFQIRIADDGEVLVKGETVMREYWQRPDETQQAFDAEGWFHTGDIGRLEDDYLYITEHKQHLMVMSTGRKIAATAIESALLASPFIAQAAVVGEGKSYVSAMIVPDLEVLANHFHERTDEEGQPIATTTHPQVKALLDQVIGEVNKGLDRWEQVREYSLLDQPLSQDAGEITASMKISRHTVAKRYAREIEAMYPESLQLDAKEVSQVQIEPERLRELLEKEKILDAWMADAGIEFLFELAREKQIDAPSMVNICDTVAMIAQMENEEIPLSTALIVGDPVRIGHVLPVSQVHLLQRDHIRRMRRILVTMAKVVDGLVLGYVVDKYGYLRGVHKLEVDLEEPENFLLGPQFRHHAAISQKCDAVVFFVPTGGRQVRIFAKGQLVGRYADGDWSPESMVRVDEIVTQLAAEKSYDLTLVHRVLRCAFRMSEKNMGAIFIVGNADDILEHSDASEISHFASIMSVNMAQMSDQELINFAKQDGATVIDVQGHFRGCMVLLRPDADTRAEIGPGKGARHSSAAKMSAEAQCLAITVSHDGPITIYDSGRRILSL